MSSKHEKKGIDVEIEAKYKRKVAKLLQTQKEPYAKLNEKWVQTIK